MASSRHNGLKIFVIVVSILLVICLVGSLLVIGRTTNGFKEIPDFDDDSEDSVLDDSSFLVSLDDSLEDSSSPFSVRFLSSDDDRLDEHFTLEMPKIDGRTLYSYVAISFDNEDADILDYSYSLKLSEDFDGYDAAGNWWMSSSDVDCSDYIYITELSYNQAFESDLFIADYSESDYFFRLDCFAPFGARMYFVFRCMDFSGDVYELNVALDYLQSPQFFSVSVGLYSAEDGLSFVDPYSCDDLLFSFDCDIFSGFSNVYSASVLDVSELCYSYRYLGILFDSLSFSTCTITGAEGEEVSFYMYISSFSTYSLAFQVFYDYELGYGFMILDFAYYHEMMLSYEVEELGAITFMPNVVLSYFTKYTCYFESFRLSYVNYDFLPDYPWWDDGEYDPNDPQWGDGDDEPGDYWK